MGGIPHAALGMIDITSGEGTAAAPDTYIKPTEHEVWVIDQFCVWHDDPAGLDLYYMYWDGTSLVRFGGPITLAVSTYTYLYKDCPYLPSPVVLTYDHWLRLNLSGIAAGKKCYYAGVITRFRGLPTGYGQ